VFQDQRNLLRYSLPENGGGMERLRVFEMKFAIRARKKASRIGFGETSPG
jgi:hypothetical protein